MKYSFYIESNLYSVFLVVLTLNIFFLRHVLLNIFFLRLVLFLQIVIFMILNILKSSNYFVVKPKYCYSNVLLISLSFNYLKNCHGLVLTSGGIVSLARLDKVRLGFPLSVD